MDDFDFYNALRTSGRESEETLELLKEAAAVSPTVMGALLGSAVFGTAAYMSNRPDDSGLSSEQRSADVKLYATHADEENKDFVPGVGRANAKYRKNLADIFANHPGKAALTAAPVGAAIGAMIARKLLKK